MNDIQRQVLTKLVDGLLEAEYTISVWKEEWLVEWADNSAEVMAALDQVKVALLALTDLETGLYAGKIYLLYPFVGSQIIDDAFVDRRALFAIQTAQELHEQLRSSHERNRTPDHYPIAELAY